MRTIWERVRYTLFRPASTAGLMMIAVLVGIAVGIATWVLVEAIDLVARLTEEVAEGLPADWIWMFVTVPIGLFLAWLIARRFAPEAAGDGVPEVMAELALRGGYVRRRLMWVKPLTTALTLGSGGSAGREGPIVQIGGAVGSAVGRWWSLGEDQLRSLVAAGAGAAIGASFNAPIAGMLFAMEVILGGFSVRHLNTVVVSSVTAAVVSRSLVGSELTFPIVKYRLNDPTELLLYGALGLIAVVAGYLFLRGLRLFEERAYSLPLPRWSVAPILGLMVAGLGLVSVHLAEEGSALAPPVLGTGQEFVGFLLGSNRMAWWILFGLAGLKILATSATLGARASGGAFAPSLFIGAAAGAAFVSLIDPVWGFSDLRSGAFALVGMSAVFAAVARAPLTSILIVFEITQDYGLVLPLMLATTLATFLTELIHRDSAYTMALRRMGIRLTRRSEVDILDSVSVGEVSSPVPIVIHPETSLGEVQGHLDRSRHHGLPVVDGDRLVGLITVTDILRSGGPSDQVTAAEAMTPHPTTATPQMPVSVALERMAALGVGRLPVVDEKDPGLLVGMFRREDAVRAYHVALDSVTHEQHVRDRLRVRTRPGANFFEFVVAPGSVADGRPVAEVAWPDGLTLVSVHRDRDVVVPTGPTVLRAGDIVTAFGTPAARERAQMRLAPPG